MDWITWINTGVGAIGIIVGIIGWRNISDAKKIKNTIKADGGATVQQAHVIHNGLSSIDVIDIAKATAAETMNHNLTKVEPNMFVVLKTTTSGTVVYWKTDSGYLYSFDLLVQINKHVKKYYIQMYFDQKEVYFPNVKCKIEDTEGNAVELYAFNGFLEMLPASIYDNELYYRQSRSTEIVFGDGQTILGKGKDKHIILLSLTKENDLLTMRAALYGPKEVCT